MNYAYLEQNFIKLITVTRFCLLSLVLQRDGCPKIINLGSRRMDLHFDKKRYGFTSR
jgi:hypothetical protein